MVECLDCGGPLNRRGAPGICAAAHDPWIPRTHADLALLTAGMTTQRWIAEIPATAVQLERLIPIQNEPTTVLRGLERRLVGAVVDPIIHAVFFDWRLYIEDGHHRFFRARRDGRAWVLARVLRV